MHDFRINSAQEIMEMQDQFLQFIDSKDVQMHEGKLLT